MRMSSKKDLEYGRPLHFMISRWINPSRCLRREKKGSRRRQMSLVLQTSGGADCLRVMPPWRALDTPVSCGTLTAVSQYPYQTPN